MKIINVLTIIILFQTVSIAQQLNWANIDLENATAVDGKINGFNMGGYAYGRMNLQGEDMSISSQCRQCKAFNLCVPMVSGPSFSSMETKSNVIEASANLKPGVLRFPGGTHSGWYHYYQYDDTGMYDAADPKIAKGYGMTLIETAHLKNPLEYCHLDSRLTINQNYLDGFIYYIKNLQNTIADNHKIEVSYVVNLLTHFRFSANQAVCTKCGRSKAIEPMEGYDCSSEFDYSYVGNEALFNHDKRRYRFELYYKETQDVLSQIVEELDLGKDDILYVEMGNEYYSNEGYPYSKYKMSPKDYGKLVEIYSQRLKCFFNGKVQIKIGIVTKPNTPWQSELVNYLQQDLNNDGTVLNDAFDAIIYHHYYNQSFCLDDPNIFSRFNCAKEAFRNHIEMDLFNQLDDLTTHFPSKKIWITEWNMLNGENNKNNSFLNTILHASFVQEYALSVMKYNAMNDNAVSMTTHHRLGDHNVWSVIQTQDGDNEVANVRSGAIAMRFLSKLYEYDNRFYLQNILFDGTNIMDTKEAVTSVFMQKGNSNQQDRLLIYYTNKTGQNIDFTIPNKINGKQVDKAYISALHGNYLFTYGPRNITAGKNRYKESGSKVYYNEQLDVLGYGLIDNQFETVYDSMLMLTDEHSLLNNSIGVIEIYFKDNTTSTNNTLREGIMLNISPNPCYETIHIDLETKEPSSIIIQLVSTMGNKIISQKQSLNYGHNPIKIACRNIPEGLYYLTFYHKNTIITKKIILVNQ